MIRVFAPTHSGPSSRVPDRTSTPLSRTTGPFRVSKTTPGSIAPSRHARERQGWRGEWSFESLVANAPIGIVLPERLNPGPLAARITFFAPVGLLFFCFVVAIVADAQGRAIHPMNFFFLGCAFFAFHLLFAYLVDHLAIAPSFAIASATSILLVTTYARLFTGWRFALQVMGSAQLVYLVLFSYTFFWEGFTGLAITIGAVVTLFVMMQYTGKVDWDRPRLQQVQRQLGLLQATATGISLPSSSAKA